MCGLGVPANTTRSERTTIHSVDHARPGGQFISTTKKKQVDPVTYLDESKRKIGVKLFTYV